LAIGHAFRGCSKEAHLSGRQTKGPGSLRRIRHVRGKLIAGETDKARFLDPLISSGNTALEVLDEELVRAFAAFRLRRASTSCTSAAPVIRHS
jgi:hypothetical protein